MKLIVAVLRKEDEVDTIAELNKKGFFVTELATTGGFLKEKNTTLLIGTDDHKLDAVLAILKQEAGLRKTVTYAATPMESGNFCPGGNYSVPIDTQTGGCTVFVLNMEQLEKYDEYLKEHLSQKRYTHSKNVSDASVMLAKKFGYPDVEKARFAGLVHDICKEEPEDVQYTLMMQSAMDVCAEERSAFKVWHGIAGAELLRTKFGVMDMDVLSAVRYHTIARAGMSDLEKIVYLADMISVERDYPDVETMRKKALESLDEGMGYALKYSLMKLVRRDALIPHHTVEAYNEILNKLHRQEG